VEHPSVYITYHLPSAPIPNVPVSVAEKSLENFSTQPASSPDLNLMDTRWLENVSMIIFATRKGVSSDLCSDSFDFSNSCPIYFSKRYEFLIFSKDVRLEYMACFTSRY
jgi:hypothetical protein